MSDPEAFILGRAERADRHALAMVTHTAFLNDAMWQEVFRNAATEDLIAYWAEVLSMRFETPDLMLMFKITELATGYIIKKEMRSSPAPKLIFDSKIVAWTCLRVPSTDTVQSKMAFPNPPKGVNLDLFQKMMQGPAQATHSFGYDPTKDFHRRGSHTHGDYQRQGHMRRLTQHCNAIADAAGGKTYSTCREAAVPLFLSEGYELLGIKNFDEEELNKLLGHAANHYALMRKPETVHTSI
jgi:hypothetical protein